MLVREDLHPGDVADRDAMLTLQRRVADAADLRSIDELDPATDRIAGVDQAFPTAEQVVSACVVERDGRWCERTYARRSLEMPYIPGLLSFREAPAALDAIARLHDPPAGLLVDGNGRIHPRGAGLATHLGVVVDRPTVGVAKSLLCGTPTAPIDDLEVGAAVPIEADDAMELPTGSVIGYALQTRQWDHPDRRINPVIVSPGHRIDATGARDLVMALCRGYKLPEPIRAADRYADRLVNRPAG